MNKVKQLLAQWRTGQAYWTAKAAMPPTDTSSETCIADAHDFAGQFKSRADELEKALAEDTKELNTRLELNEN